MSSAVPEQQIVHSALLLQVNTSEDPGPVDLTGLYHPLGDLGPGQVRVGLGAVGQTEHAGYCRQGGDVFVRRGEYHGDELLQNFRVGGNLQPTFRKFC